jgi:hypothetical protein
LRASAFQQLRQLGDVGGEALRFVVGEKFGRAQPMTKLSRKEAPAPRDRKTGRGKDGIELFVCAEPEGLFPNRHSNSMAPQKSASHNGVRLLALNFSFYCGCLLEHRYPYGACKNLQANVVRRECRLHYPSSTSGQLRLPQQLRQLGDVGGDAPRLGRR